MKVKVSDNERPKVWKSFSQSNGIMKGEMIEKYYWCSMICEENNYSTCLGPISRQDHGSWDEEMCQWSPCRTIWGEGGLEWQRVGLSPGASPVARLRLPWSGLPSPMRTLPLPGLICTWRLNTRLLSNSGGSTGRISVMIKYSQHYT